jgi:hypothetical protein
MFPTGRALRTQYEGICFFFKKGHLLFSFSRECSVKGTRQGWPDTFVRVSIPIVEFPGEANLEVAEWV